MTCPNPRCVELERGLVEIIRLLAEGQPAPRSASVTYVAGYARAMEDMQRVVFQAVQNINPSPSGEPPWTENPSRLEAGT